MKVVLMDLDVIKQRRPFPNLALMKLSAYHKAKGDEVFLNFPLFQPDITYASCVFTWNAKGRASVPNGAIVGGSGIDLKAKLLPEVEHIMPDYNLYPRVDSSMGFTSRGCIRKCPWCIVPEKEGSIKSHASPYEFLDRRFKKIMLLDNNLLACSSWHDVFADLMNIGLEVDFRQGLDIRLVNDEVAKCLVQLKIKQLRFAFDDIAYESAVRRGIEFLLANGINSRHLSFYTLVSFNDDDKIVERVNILHSYNVEIYPMPYRGMDGKVSARRILEVANIPLMHGARRNINKFLRLVGRLP